MNTQTLLLNAHKRANDASLSPLARKRSQNLIEKQITIAFARHSHEVLLPMGSIPKIYEDCRKAIACGEDLDTALKASIEVNRVRTLH